MGYTPTWTLAHGRSCENHEATDDAVVGALVPIMEVSFSTTTTTTRHGPMRPAYTPGYCSVRWMRAFVGVAVTIGWVAITSHHDEVKLVL